MDLCRIDRLTEIGGDWGGQFRPVNAVPMRQFRPNLRPIETPFWIGEISSILENRGQSYAMQEPIRCQSWLSQTDNLLPIGHQSAANPVHMACQSGDNPVPIPSQSCSNLVSICFQFTLQSGSNPSIIYCRQDVNQLPILCQSGSSPVPIRHHSEANGLPGLNDPATIQCKSTANP